MKTTYNYYLTFLEVGSLKWDSKAVFLLNTLNAFLCVYQLLEATYIAQLLAPFSRHSGLCFCCHIAFSESDPPAPLLYGPNDYIGPNAKLRTIPHPKIPSVITFANYLLYCKVAYSQGSGIRIWTSFGFGAAGSYSVQYIIY